ncbi:MAG: glycerophosphodiester phosphodiesterase family protein [Pseudomonadota bacterium]
MSLGPPLLVATLLSATTVNTMHAATTSRPRAIEVQGHRGARARFPENTLPAFAHALQVGVDVLELDVVVTADDQLLVMHDPVVSTVLCRHRDGTAVAPDTALRSLRLVQAQALDCGAVQNPRFPAQSTSPGTPPPSLVQVFELLRSSPAPAARTVRLNIEAKSVPGRTDLSPPPDRFARLVVDSLQDHGMVSRAVLQSFDHRILIEAKKFEPALTTAVLIDETLPDLVAVARAAGAAIVSPHQDWITATEVHACHAAGLRVIPWTVNEEKSWRRMLELDVDGIITDDPEALIAFLKVHQRH